MVKLGCHTASAPHPMTSGPLFPAAPSATPSLQPLPLPRPNHHTQNTTNAHCTTHLGCRASSAVAPPCPAVPAPSCAAPSSPHRTGCPTHVPLTQGAGWWQTGTGTSQWSAGRAHSHRPAGGRPAGAASEPVGHPGSPSQHDSHQGWGRRCRGTAPEEEEGGEREIRAAWGVRAEGRGARDNGEVGGVCAGVHHLKWGGWGWVVGGWSVKSGQKRV